MLIIAGLVWPSYLHANPTGGTVVGGQATISGEGTSSVTVTQQSERGIINWQDFSIGTGETVRFEQPGAASVTANRVIGVDPSLILGQMSATGQLLLINPNGIVFGANAIVDSAAFVATTHDFSDSDFMTSLGSLRFEGAPDGAQIINNGSLLIREGGIAALASPQLINNGVVSARLGTVTMVASAGFSMDLFGDGLLSFAPGDDVAATIGDGGTALITNAGEIAADGGTIVMTARAAAAVINASVNIDGIIRAQSVAENAGVISLTASGTLETAAASRLDASGAGADDGGQISIVADTASLGGTISADGANGGDIDIDVTNQLSLGGDLSADGVTGGRIAVDAGRIIANTASDLSATGSTRGGVIVVAADNGLMSSGRFDVSSSAGAAGRIDITAAELKLLSARFDASGAGAGGQVRIGGAFQGGMVPDVTTSYYHTFLGRWADRPDLTAARTSFLNDGTMITVASANGDGGTVVVWSDEETTFLGSIDARGASEGGGAGGSVELSSAVMLRHAALGNVRVDGGTLLLDPKNITIGSSAEVKSWTYRSILEGVDENDYFGANVTLAGTARAMAVGITGDDGSGGASASGAVRLYTFTGDAFTGAALAGTIGDGYTGTGNVDVANLAANDFFGSAVSLDGDGDRLAVGARQDDGRSNNVSNGGAVYLFTFTNTSFAGGTLASTIGSNYTTTGDFDVVALGDNDDFGQGVSLSNDGTRLVVGAPEDDGSGDGSVNAGAVYMFTFADGSFGTPSLTGVLGDGYNASGSMKVDTVAAGDRFGNDVALDADGNRLVVGASGDDGSGGGNVDSGAVYLISFDDTSYGNPSVTGQIGKGYNEGDSDLVPTGLGAGDEFGSSVSLNAAGDWLLVGAPEDDGSGSSSGDEGAAYLFRFTDADFGGPSQQSVFGEGYTGGQNVNVSLQSNEFFGFSVALDDTAEHIAIGGWGRDDTDTNEGAVRLYAGTHNSGGYGVQAINDSYSEESSSSVTVNIYDIIDMMRRGTDVALKASNDITIGDKLTVPTDVTSGGALRMFAGRSVLINNDVTTNNSDLEIVANDLAANGVVDAQRASGAAVITMATGTSINAGSGDVVMRIRDGTGNSQRTSGDITLGSISANTITVENSGFTSATAVVINSGASLVTTGSGDALVIKSDVFTNNAGSNALAPGGSGRFLVWSSAPTTDTRGNLSHGFKQYGATYGSTTPAGSGSLDAFLYALAPSLSATLTGSFTKTYDATNSFTPSASNFSASGTVDGDSVVLGSSSGTFSQSNIGDGLSVSVGNIGVTSASNGAVTVYGYTAPSGTLTTTSGKISQAVLSVANTQVVDKNYDGTANATFTLGTVSGLQGGETLTVTPSGSFASKNVASDINVATSYSLADGTGLASNYSIGGETLTGTITPRPLTVSGSSVADKTYDGGATASISTGSLVNLVTGETLGVTASGGFTSVNAGVGINVPVTYNLSAGSGDIANYSIGGETLTADITPLAISISGSSAANKTYDATNSATISAGSLSGMLGGDTLTVTGSGSFASVNVGTGINVATSYTLGDDGGLAANYTLADQTLTAAITRRALGITGSGVTSKTYDSTNSAAISAGSLTNLVASQTLGVTGSGTYASTDVGSGINVAASYTLSDGSGLASNYSLAGETLTGAITQRALTISGSNVTSKTYDGTNSATISAGSLGNLAAGESLSVTGSGSYASTNVGSSINVATTYTLADSGGFIASNYSLAGETLTGAITQRALTISGSNVTSKTYDGTNSATISAGSLTNLVASQTLGVTGSGSYASTNVGSGINVAASYVLTDGSGLASNYSLAGETLTGAITQKVLAVTGTTATDRAYDSTTTATVGAGTLVGTIGGQTLGLSATGSFADANVGNSKYVTVSYALADGTGLASNYSLANGGASASITRKALDISGASVSDKTYDGDALASVSGGSLTGLEGGETLTLTSSAAFADANAGVNKNATISYSLADGTGAASNYSLANKLVTGTINQRALSITAPSAANKVYDGTTVATVNAGTLSNLVGGQTLGVTASGTFGTKGVGSGKSVSVAYSITDGSGLAANYSLAAGSSTATITAKPLSVTGTNITDRVYDGTTAATVIGVGTLAGVVGGDTVTLNSSSITAAFADKNAGNGKAVALSGLSIAGADAANYSLTNPSATGTITKKALAITTPSVQDRNFDGTSKADVIAGTLSGFVNGETLTVQANGLFSSAAAGVGKIVTISYELFDGINGGMAANYRLADDTATADVKGVESTKDRQMARIMLDTLVKAQEQIVEIGNKVIEMTIAEEPETKEEGFVESMGEWQMLACDGDSAEAVCGGI